MTYRMRVILKKVSLVKKDIVCEKKLYVTY